MSERRVHILHEHLANQIAAGEVIQRPESVVKELLENALDAGAKQIVVVVKEGGKKLIQVIDDGDGMSEEDAVASFQRHATSKIATLEDLEAIRTYGFRGEALASIAAVAHVTMKTRRREDETAVVVQIEGGGGQRVSREAREAGTSISVQNLFYNTPARRKFLKSAATELRHIAEAVQRVALSQPEVALRFISEEETLLDLKAASLQERMLGVFGQRQVEGMVWAEEQTELMSVYGFIGKPSFGQKSRANQYIFLNRRYIVNRNISHAVFTAYENLLIKGTFPFFVLFIDIDPHRVDVNVHPSKLEAKFEDEQYVYRLIATLVRRTLVANDLIPTLSLSTPGAGDRGIGLSFTDRQHAWNRTSVDPLTGEILSSPRAAQSSGEGSSSFIPHVVQQNGKEIADRLFGERTENDPGALPAGDEVAFGHHIAQVWQLHHRYLLTPIEGGLLIVDQHVAHERVLYERARQRTETHGPVRQQVLFPEPIELPPVDFALIEELLPHFEQLGFGLKVFGKNTVLLEGVPADLPATSDAKVIADILMLYREYRQHGMIDARDVLAKSYACRAAIKSGDPLNESEMRSLLDQLFSCTMPYVCPHGRPIALKVSIDELDRRFGRT